VLTIFFFVLVIINLGGVRQSYLGPPESFRVGSGDVVGEGRTNFAGVDVTRWANGVLGSASD
jgi:hypothetical protein